MKILLAVDGSPYTKKMLAYLAANLDMFVSKNNYTLLTVRTPLPPRAAAAVGKSVVNEYHAEEAAKVLDPVVKFLARHDVTPKTAWKSGPPGETIARFADSGKFDLLIMGSHGHGALGNLVMGSVATKVLANCEVPVLLVR